VRLIAGECTYVDERGAVALRLEPAAAIDENQDGTRGSNLLCSSGGSDANLTFGGTSPDAAYHELLPGKTDDGVGILAVAGARTRCEPRRWAGMLGLAHRP
jgi:hypothetical protein